MTTKRPATVDAKTLETFPNPAPHRDYQIHMEIPEFTCLCPKTGQPDFAVLTLDYIADKLCVELKSLKLYYQGFRTEGIFYEAVTNRIRDDLAGLMRPAWLQIVTAWRGRGGIRSVIRARTWATSESLSSVRSVMSRTRSASSRMIGQRVGGMSWRVVRAPSEREGTASLRIAVRCSGLSRMRSAESAAPVVVRDEREATAPPERGIVVTIRRVRGSMMTISSSTRTN